MCSNGCFVSRNSQTLDGPLRQRHSGCSDVETYLADRIKRRDVFMTVMVTMIWEYVFTRYLFGMDSESRQKLKALEKLLAEVGPARVVDHWRAISLTLMSKRPTNFEKSWIDSGGVVKEIFAALATLLPATHHLENQLRASLGSVLKLAIHLSIEMRTQAEEYIVLPPLQPEYDANGDLASKVYFNSALTNERSGGTVSTEELQERHAVVRMVLFPLVVRKDANGEKIAVCPA